MALMAIAFPIRSGESEGWKNWVGELQHGPRHAEFVASHEFTTWFLAKTMEFHGIDLRAPAGPPPELLVDSEA